MRDEFLWVEKYRPKTVADTVLPDQLKKTFSKFVEQKNIPNLLLTGKAGIGKTTVARAMLEELGCDYIVINGSLYGNIDTLRNEILNFASTVSFFGGRKYVILDEADYLNPNSTQPALRNFMEQYSSNCGFILTCNYPNKIIKELHSRCSVVEFKVTKEEKLDIARQFLDSCLDILNKEGIKFEKPAVIEVMTKFFPDFRRIINELQRYSAATGVIDAGILTNFGEISLKKLIGFMKEKDFTQVRKWVTENTDMDTVGFYRQLYDTANQYFTPVGNAQLIRLLSQYQYREAFVPDKEINTAALCVDIMLDCSFR